MNNPKPQTITFQIPVGEGPDAKMFYDLDKVEILGLAELADRWGISKQRVDEITSTRLPHWRKLSCGRVWLLHEVTKFEKSWTRQTGIHITPHKGRRDQQPSDPTSA